MKPDLYPHELAEWERAARKTRKAHSDPESRLWAVLCALVLGIGIGGGALLHVIGRYFA